MVCEPRLCFAGIDPISDWVKQVCRNLTDSEDGFMRDASHLIVDRDASFVALWEYLDTKTEIDPVVLLPKSPNLNAYLERFFRSLKSECVDRMIFFSRKRDSAIA